MFTAADGEPGIVPRFGNLPDMQFVRIPEDGHSRPIYQIQGALREGEKFRGYRNGYHSSRELTVGVSPEGFESKIVKRYEMTSRHTQDLFRKLYMEGLYTGGL